MINPMVLCYGLAIRYDRLKLLVMDAFKKYYNAESINIFIDTYEIFKGLYKPDYLEGNNLDLCSGIINLAAHYKQFFKQYCKDIKIYIIHSDNVPSRNIELYPRYNRKMVHLLQNKSYAVNNIEPMNLDVLDLLCKYIEDVYIIHSNYESAVVMYDIISKDKDDRVNLIISKDSYTKQLSAICPKTVIFRPYKTKGVDLSYYTNEDNLFNTIMYERGVEQRDFSKISPQLFSLLFALNGFRSRNISVSYNIQTAMKLVKNAIDNNIILNSYNSIIDWDAIQFKEDSNLIKRKYECLDVLTQHSIFVNDIESNYKLEDLYDPKALQSINDTYFTSNNQLNLNAL